MLETSCLVELKDLRDDNIALGSYSKCARVRSLQDLDVSIIIITILIGIGWYSVS